MDQQFCIFLYSKYSDVCKRLMNQISNYNLFMQTYKVNFVCIDNEKIRERILNSKNIKISKVPCILVGNVTGTIDTYEGIEAFRWIDLGINNIKMSLPPVEDDRNTKIENLEEEEEEEEILPKKKILKKRAPKKQKERYIQEEDEEEEPEENIKKPPVLMRDGPGTYKMSPEFEKDGEEIDQIATVRETKGGKAKISDLAAQLQKERERDETANKGQTPV